MTIRTDQIETLLAAIHERTPPAPLSRPMTPAQDAYIRERLPAAFESIGIHTITDPALRAVLASNSHLYAIRERALHVQPAGLFSRRFFRFRDRMPALHATLVRLLTDAAGIGQHKVRLWNPACGAGADTWSLAAMVRLAQAATGTHDTAIEILGSDVLPDAIRYAEAGVYEFRRGEWRRHRESLVALFGDGAVPDDADLPISTRHLPAGADSYFSVSRLDDGGYTITPRPSLREIVRFRFVNPLRMPELGQIGTFDAVATFEPALLDDTPTARQHRAALAVAVRRGGYLIVRVPPGEVNPPSDWTGPGRDFELIEPGLFCRRQ